MRVLSDLDSNVWYDFLGQWLNPFMLTRLKTACTNRVLAPLLDRHVNSCYFRSAEEFVEKTDYLSLINLSWLWTWLQRIGVSIDWVVRYDIDLEEEMSSLPNDRLKTSVMKCKFITLGWEETPSYALQPTVEVLAKYISACGDHHVPVTLRLSNCHAVTFSFFRAVDNMVWKSLIELILENMTYEEVSALLIEYIACLCPKLQKFHLEYKEKKIGKHKPRRNPVSDESAMFAQLIHGSPRLRSFRVEYYGEGSKSILLSFAMLKRRAAARIRDIKLRLNAEYNYDTMVLGQVVMNCPTLTMLKVFSETKRIYTTDGRPFTYSMFEYKKSDRSGKKSVTIHDKSFANDDEPLQCSLWTPRSLQFFFAHVSELYVIHFLHVETCDLEHVTPFIALKNATTLRYLTMDNDMLLNEDHNMEVFACVHRACLNTRAAKNGFIKFTETGAPRPLIYEEKLNNDVRIIEEVQTDSTGSMYDDDTNSDV